MNRIEFMEDTIRTFAGYSGRGQNGCIKLLQRLL